MNVGMAGPCSMFASQRTYRLLKNINAFIPRTGRADRPTFAGPLRLWRGRQGGTDRFIFGFVVLEKHAHSWSIGPTSSRLSARWASWSIFLPLENFLSRKLITMGSH